MCSRENYDLNNGKIIRGWVNSIFQLLALLGNKNWPPSMKGKKLQKFGNKKGLMGCKWSSLNAPGTGNPLSHPILKLGDCPFSKILALWGNKNCPPSMKVKKVEKFGNKSGLMGCKWSSLNVPRTSRSFYHPIWKLKDYPFLCGLASACRPGRYRLNIPTALCAAPPRLSTSERERKFVCETSNLSFVRLG